MSENHSPSFRDAFLKEWKAAFASPAAYVYGAVLLLVVGFFTLRYNVTGQLSNFEYAINASAWILIPLSGLAAFWMHKRLHPRAPKAVKASDEAAKTTKASDEAAKTSKASEDSAKASAEAKAKDDAAEAPADDSEQPSPATVPALFAISAVALLIPTLLMCAYALILSSFGEVYLPSVLNEATAFFFLGLVANAFALSLAATRKNRLLTILFTLAGMLLSYYILPISTYCTTPYATMLFFTLVIALIAVYVLLVSQNQTLALLVAAVLEILQVICFVIAQNKFFSLAPIVLAKLSLFERFHVFVGGLFDGRAILYFAAVCALLLSLAKAGYGYEPSPKKESSDDASETKEKLPAFDNYPVKVPAIVLCAGIVVFFLTQLSGTALLADATSTHLITPTEQLKQDVQKLDKDITIYHIVQNGREDESLRSVLAYYDAMSSHITVTHCSPTVQYDFITAHVLESIYNNSLLFECGDLYRFVSFNDLYSYDYSNYDTTGTYEMKFEVEDQMAHALEYVSGMTLNRVYQLTGHGENQLSAFFRTIFEKEDVDLVDLEYLTEVPEDASAILINAPATDLSDEEADQLFLYLQRGGRLFLLTRVQASDENNQQIQLKNLYSVMIGYGAALIPGVVMESGSAAYDTTNPYNLQPNVITHPVTDPLVASRTAPLLSIAQGMMTMEVGGVTLTPLLLTSYEGYSKVDGYNSTTYEMEDGDYQGIMPLAAAIEAGDTRIVWVTSASLFVDDVNTASNNGNRYFSTGAMNWLTGGSAHTVIPGKSYNYGVLMFNNEFAASRLTLLFCFAFPFAYLAIGLMFLFAKLYRKNQAEAAALAEKQRLEDEARQREDEEREAKREASRRQKEEATRAAIERQREKNKKNSQ